MDPIQLVYVNFLMVTSHSYSRDLYPSMRKRAVPSSGGFRRAYTTIRSSIPSDS
jgi:hypothetical protein